jgi:Polysaccharide lyase
MRNVLSLFYCLFSVTQCHTQQQQFMYNVGWESGDILQGKLFNKFSLCNPPYDGMVSDSFARSGTKSARFEVRTTDTICGYSIRAELYNYLTPGFTFWTAFSEYIPEWSASDVRELHGQMHDKGKLGSPLWGLWVDEDRWKFAQAFDTLETGTQIQFKHDLGPVKKGVWTDWVIYNKFRLDPTGEIKVWRNGELVLELHGANYNMVNGEYQPVPYFKFGIYKWTWKKHDTGNVTKRVLYMDDVKMADSTATINNFLYPQNKKE